MKQLILFTAPWCEHCQALKSTLEVVKQQGISVQEVDVDQDLKRAKLANVQNIPTVVLAENEQEVRRFTGTKSFNEIMQFYKG
jgi:thioredoxin-like negative regulator of GroEL